MGRRSEKDESQSGDRHDASGDDLLRQIAHVSDAPVPAEEEPLDGKTIGRFCIRGELGSGGMGVVYRAEDEKLRREVALKVLRAEHARDDERRRRFLREARSASAISHPNIASVYEVGEDGERVYIAMELVRGESLRRVIARGGLPHDEALRIGVAVAQALAKAHAAGIVHRDVKPDNVMVQPDGGVKVLDFGLAKVFAAEGTASAESITELTADGRILGTPSYMSPEQASGRATDARSDVFSLGVVLYEMLARRRPFVGDTTLDILVSINRDVPAPLSAVAPSVPRAVAAVVDRCLRKDRDARPGDGGELASALEEAATARARARPSALVVAVCVAVVVVVVGALALRGASAGSESELAAASVSAHAPATSASELATAPSSSIPSAASAIASAPAPSVAAVTSVSPPPTGPRTTKPRTAPSLDPLGDQK